MEYTDQIAEQKDQIESLTDENVNLSSNLKIKTEKSDKLDKELKELKKKYKENVVKLEEA